MHVKINLRKAFLWGAIVIVVQLFVHFVVQLRNVRAF